MSERILNRIATVSALDGANYVVRRRDCLATRSTALLLYLSAKGQVLRIILYINTFMKIELLSHFTHLLFYYFSIMISCMYEDLPSMTQREQSRCIALPSSIM